METWIDIIPAIPLARGVPVIVKHGSHPSRHQHAVCLHHFRDQWVVHDGAQHFPVADHMLRVDLDDPQGFGYALRWLLQQKRVEDDSPAWMAAMALSQDYAVLRGETTTADRLALARALAEVA